MQVRIRRCFNFAKFITNIVFAPRTRSNHSRDFRLRRTTVKCKYFNDKVTQSNCANGRIHIDIWTISISVDKVVQLFLSSLHWYAVGEAALMCCETIIRHSAVSIFRLERVQSTGQNPKHKSYKLAVIDPCLRSPACKLCVDLCPGRIILFRNRSQTRAWVLLFNTKAWRNPLCREAATLFQRFASQTFLFASQSHNNNRSVRGKTAPNAKKTL